MPDCPYCGEWFHPLGFPNHCASCKKKQKSD